MPQVPAKYTIEVDCANNTCQSETEEPEDHSPAPLVKTGVIDVISHPDLDKLIHNAYIEKYMYV